MDHAILGGGIDPTQPHAAAVFANPTGPIHQLVPVEDQGVFPLQRFDRQVRCIGRMHMDPVQPIGIGPRATTAADGFQINPIFARLWPAGPRAGKDRDRTGRIGTGRNPIRHRLGQRAQDQIGDPLTGLYPPIDRRRMGAVQDRAVGRRHVDGTGQPGIGQNAGVDHRFHNVIDRRQQRRARHVDGGADLRRGFERQGQRIACHRQGDGQGDRIVEIEIVEHILEPPAPIGQGSDTRAHLALGIIQQRLARGQHDVDPMALAQFGEPLHAHPVRRHLRAQIRQTFARDLAIQQDQLLDIFLQNPSAVQADRGDPQALLVDMRMSPVDEIGMMRQVHRPGDQGVIDKDRLGQNDIGQMGAAAAIGVIANKDIAGAQILYVVIGQQHRDEIQETAQMDRDMFGLAQGPALAIKQRGRTIAPFLDIGRIRGAHQRLSGFLDNRRQRRSNDFHGDRIQLGGDHGASSKIRLSIWSTRALTPGGISVVVSICSTMAGPAKAIPGTNASRA